MKGSLTATSSMSSLCNATLVTNLPILPKPTHTKKPKNYENIKNKKNDDKDMKLKITIDSNLNFAHDVYNK